MAPRLSEPRYVTRASAGSSPGPAQLNGVTGLARSRAAIWGPGERGSLTLLAFSDTEIVVVSESSGEVEGAWGGEGASFPSGGAARSQP
jgi:hypothetical protein